jgi:AbiJ N-terminal domain 4
MPRCLALSRSAEKLGIANALISRGSEEINWTEQPRMLTDIFAYRYLDQPIQTTYTEAEQRLLNQTFGIVKDALPYFVDGNENEKQKTKWKLLHDRLARELGLNDLSQRYYSYTKKNVLVQDLPVSGWFSWDHVCGQFVNAQYTDQHNADRFIKERVSFIELAVRLRGEEVVQLNANLPVVLQQVMFRHASMRSSAGVIGSAVDRVKADNATINSALNTQILELNERFRRAKAPLRYHNGFIQFAMDQRIEQQVAKPFWDLVSDPLWKNVDIDMKEALDRRDSNDKDPSIFAAKALESAIKIVSDTKQWTRGTENGAAQYVDNLVSKINGSFLAPWEGEMLKDYFRKVRNSVGHGPGSEPMPELSLAQTDWAIETAMSWVRTLVRRT